MTIAIVVAIAGVLVIAIVVFIVLRRYVQLMRAKKDGLFNTVN